MAGIGFKLQKLLAEEMYLSVFQGFFYSLIITSGPWLIMVVSLEALSFFSTFLISVSYQQLFKILLVHIYAITIIITGTFQLFFTRIFADKMYYKERESLPDVIMTHLIFTLIVLTVIILPLIILLNTAFPIKMMMFSLFLATDISWVLLNYVSASDDFLGFIKHFLFGSGISFILGSGFGYWFDFFGLFLGFLIGQAYVAIVLFIKTAKVFGFPNKLDFSMIRIFPHYHILLASGFLLYAGVWIDKFIFWYGPFGKHLDTILYYHFEYNEIFYLAFLFTTPIMAIFFLSMETSFYKIYYTYNKAVFSKGQQGSLSNLNRYRNEIKASVKNSLTQIVRIQGLIIVLGILFSKEILAFLHIPANADLLLNIILIGVFFHMLILILCVILLYFDLKKEPMKIYTVFFLLNGIMTLLFMQLGEKYSGLGYTMAAIIVFVYTVSQLNDCLSHINYLTFTRQRVPEEKAIEKEIFIPATGGYGRYYIKNGEKLIDTV